MTETFIIKRYTRMLLNERGEWQVAEHYYTEIGWSINRFVAKPFVSYGNAGVFVQTQDQEDGVMYEIEKVFV